MTSVYWCCLAMVKSVERGLWHSEQPLPKPLVQSDSWFKVWYVTLIGEGGEHVEHGEHGTSNNCAVCVVHCASGITKGLDFPTGMRLWQKRLLIVGHFCGQSTCFLHKINYPSKYEYWVGWFTADFRRNQKVDSAFHILQYHCTCRPGSRYVTLRYVTLRYVTLRLPDADIITQCDAVMYMCKWI